MNLAELRGEAWERLDPVHRDFFAGGAGEERTVRANETAFDSYRILPRVLRGGGERDLRTPLLGGTLSMPVLVSPTAFHRLAHPEGEVGCARAVAAAGTVLVLSMAATTPIEAVAAAPGGDGRPLRFWFQLYPQPDLGFTESLVRRAEAAGARALVVTVDSPVFGRRERDLRNGFLDLPPGLCCENMRDPETGRVRDIVLDPDLGWAQVDWLRATTRLPVVLKGILHPADARLAVAHGVDAVWVSNHGGRQLDGAAAAVDALPAVVAAVEGRIPVLLDGGVRRGSDVLTALALGAVAVGLGRPVIWGLAARGGVGVGQVLDLLRADLARVMTLAGAVRPADLGPDLLCRAVPG
ncbi:alpha-hydroxy acid oxidase [Plantactinospora sp. WMMB782]|uniref:alpha-hydroxy acid oxidase n=1 Tax=Plantactinospora sp. WMMB782 TaxID=3404121 RepID=UPI003B929FAD